MYVACVQGDAGAVVAHRGSRIGVASCFLDVPERHAGVEGGGDEGLAQGVGSHPFRDPGQAGGPRTMRAAPAVEPLSGGDEEDQVAGVEGSEPLGGSSGKGGSTLDGGCPRTC